MKKRIVCLMGVMTLAVCMLAAQGGQEKPKQQGSVEQPQGSGGNTTENGLGSFSLPISPKPVEFTIFLNFNNMPFNPEWPVWQEMAKRTNVRLKSVISQSNSNEKEAFNLMLSSGKLADVIGYVSGTDLEKLGRDGGLLPLNDLIRQYASHIQYYLDHDRKFANTAYSLDGNIYYVPKNQSLKFAEFWWIRKDWLDKLGLQIPTTVDELHTVLTAFRNQDPNGNGVKDEIPLFDRAAYKMPDQYLYLWDTSTEFYVRDGKVEFEPMGKNFPTGVKEFAKWYQEGLVDPEFFTRGAKARDILLAGNLGGFTHDWVSTGDYNSKLQKDIPGFEMVAMAPPQDQNGVVKERIERYPGVGWGISTQCKDPVTLIKFFDYCFTQDGLDLMNWGIEGQTYTRASDGTKQFMDVVLNNPMTPVGYLRSLGALYRVGTSQDGDYEIAIMAPVAKEAANLYESHPEWYLADEPPYADGRLDLKLLPEDDAAYKKIMSSIRPYVDEKFQSWILGTGNFDKEYPAFLQELNNRGIQDAIAIVQRGYDVYKSR